MAYLLKDSVYYTQKYLKLESETDKVLRIRRLLTEKKDFSLDKLNIFLKTLSETRQYGIKGKVFLLKEYIKIIDKI